MWSCYQRPATIPTPTASTTPTSGGTRNSSSPTPTASMAAPSQVCAAVQVVLRDDPVAAQDPPHRPGPRPDADRPQRDRVLDGAYPGAQVDLAHLVAVMAPLVAALARPQQADQVDALVQLLGPLADAGGLAGLGQAGGADAHAQDGPAAGQLVECDDLAGDLPGPPPRQRGEHGAEPDADRPGRDRGQQAPGVHAGGELGHEHAVPARFLGQHRLLELLSGAAARQHGAAAQVRS